MDHGKDKKTAQPKTAERPAALQSPDRVQFQRELAGMSVQQQIEALQPERPLVPVQMSADRAMGSAGQNVQLTPTGGGSSGTTPAAGPPRTDAEYRAVPDFATFARNCHRHLKIDAATALGYWKRAVDALQVAQAQWDALGGDWGRMTGWVDSVGRVPFGRIADDLLPDDFPNPTARYGLWSGGDAAQNYAAARVTILERTIVGKIFNKLNILDERKWGINQAIWRGLSDTYARRIALIASGIQCFQRKVGDVYAEVEAPAIEEEARLAGVDVDFFYHALLAPERFGKDSKREGNRSNDHWRDEFKTLLGEALARERFPVLFRNVTAGDLTEPNAAGYSSSGAWAGAIAAHEDPLFRRYGDEYTRLNIININTADADLLTALKGVGPATAANIISYRSRTRFARPEDIKNVSGIGEAKFAQNSARIVI